MAEVLSKFPRPSRQGGGRSIYPWPEWLDGRIWKLQRGHDFTCTVSVLRKCADHAAMRRGGKVRAHTSGSAHDATLTIQFYRVASMPVFRRPAPRLVPALPPTPEEPTQPRPLCVCGGEVRQ